MSSNAYSRICLQIYFIDSSATSNSDQDMEPGLCVSFQGEKFKVVPKQHSNFSLPPQKSIILEAFYAYCHTPMKIA